MADIFISYKREERQKARVIAEAIAAEGYSVWWDVDLLSGESFGAELEAIIRKAKASIVLWSSLSIHSHWVREEAELARTLGTLVPVLLDDADPPFGFRGINAENLRSWTGSLKAPELDRLLRAIRQKAGPAPDQSPRSASEVETAVNAFHYEATYWASISQSSVQRVSEYETYLERFGEAAQFGDLARSRISTLSHASRKPVFGTLTKWGGGLLGTAAAIATIWVAVFPANNDSATINTNTNSGMASEADEVHSLSNYSPGQVFRDAFDDGGRGPEMVVLPAGTFMIGSPSSEIERHEDEDSMAGPGGSQVRVTIHKPFAVGKYEVKWEEWAECISDGMCDGSISRNIPKNVDSNINSLPVTNIDWDDTKDYVEWLSQKSGENYRLLTEAEWEYAARSGKITAFSFGSTITSQQANFDGSYTYGESPVGDFLGKAMPVGSYKQNSFGLHDMHGNVAEWVEDCFRNSYADLPTNGSASLYNGCPLRTVRGGSWANLPRNLRSAYRTGKYPEIKSLGLGFRVARPL